MRTWLTLALLLLTLPGCYDMHGPPGGSGADASVGADGSASPDAAMCTGAAETAPGIVSELSCPAWVPAGAPVTVTVVHAPTVCCPESSSLPPLVSSAAGTTTIEPRWDLCDCCLACRCVTAPIEQAVTVTEHAEGTALVVRAGTEACTIEVRAVGMCHPLPIDGYLVPDAVALGDAAPIDVRSGGGFVGCGCTPTASSAPGEPGVTMSACDCCVDCDCIDFGYEATALVDLPREPGTHFIALGDLEGAGVEVVDRARCSSGASAGLDVGDPILVAPSERRVQARPMGVWAEIPVEQMRCCGDPRVLADVSAPVDGLIDVALSECDPDPCDCFPGSVRAASPNVFLGYLPSGEYRVRIGERVTPLVVP